MAEKVWTKPLFPTFGHNTMLTNYDISIHKDEVKLVDSYVISNNLPEMNLEVFKQVVCTVLPQDRAELIVSDFYHDDKGQKNYEKYLSY